MPLMHASRLFVWKSAACCALLAASGLGGSRAAAQTVFDQVDYTKLKSRVGAALPTGAGGVISMVEAPTSPMSIPPNAYFVDGSVSEFTAATDTFGMATAFSDGTGNAGNGNSSHATFVVGVNYFGNNSSTAPGANNVTIYEVNDWLNSKLNYLSNAAPTPQPFRVQNHSWIAPTLGTTQDISALRRFDYLIETGEMTAVVGANNNSAPATLLAHPHLMVSSYNAIVAGRSDGSHSRGTTGSFGYGTGRYKPDLVTPSASSSASTARISSAAALLHEPAAGTDAARSEVMKAILMAGATKQEFAAWTDPTTGLLNPWDHSPSRPLDDVFGAGELNIYNSYLTQRGGKQAGSQIAPSSSVTSYGWDYQDHKGDAGIGDLFYNFTVPGGSMAKELSIMLAWNVKVTDTNGSPAIFAPQESLQNLDLQFYNSTAGFLSTLVDQSISTIDNVEHIYLKNLTPGTYTLKVSGAADWDYGLAWRTATAFNQPSADFDENGFVDGADFLAWQRNSGTLLNASHAQGDANGDGSVDVDDLALLVAAGVVSGQTTRPAAGGSATGGSGSALHGVPEPASAVLATVSALMFLAGRTRRRE